MTFAGVVLCGGASRRMGQDKALLAVDGTPMALRVAETLRTAGATEVRAVGGDAGALAALGLEVVADDLPGEGPFAATITALRRTSQRVVVVLSCDLLRPSPRAVRALVERLGQAPAEVMGAVPVAGGHHQWTHAAWRTGALGSLELAYASGARSLWQGAASLPLIEVRGLHIADLDDADVPADLG